MSFPKGFVWGAASAAYQVEGAAYEDGKGLSVWDMMCRWPGKIMGGDTGDTACDQYHRYEEDVSLMGEIGLGAYRFSISWPRIIPEGIGLVNKKGLDFYDRLTDALLKRGIQPWVTLFHWDYPYSLFCRGGWLNGDSSDWFADYAAVIVDRLSDRVQHWITLNEPQCFIGLGHQSGIHAPGLSLDFPEILLATHNTLLAHGKAVQAIRARARRQPAVGAAPVGITSIPTGDSKLEIEVAREEMFSVTEKSCWNNTWFADPMIWGRYPEDGLNLFQADLPKIKTGDMETICQPLDFYGANIYHGQVVGVSSNGSRQIISKNIGAALTAMEWEVVPSSLYWGPKFLYERYHLPIVVTENGMANCDWVHDDGRVHDPQRIDFLSCYLQEYGKASVDGVDIRGYFLWSAMDNFEWSFGYNRRFGIIYIDYPTQQRVLKDSAFWYQGIIAANGFNNELCV